MHYSRPAFLVGLFAVPTESVNCTSRLRPALYPSNGVAMLPRRAPQWPQHLCVGYCRKWRPRRGGGAAASSPRHISNRRRRSSRLCSKRLRKGMRCMARWRGRYLFVKSFPNKTEKIAKRAENRRAPIRRAKTADTPLNYTGSEGAETRPTQIPHPLTPTNVEGCPFSTPKTPDWYRRSQAHGCRIQRTWQLPLAPPRLPFLLPFRISA